MRDVNYVDLRLHRLNIFLRLGEESWDLKRSLGTWRDVNYVDLRLHRLNIVLRLGET